MVGPCLLEYAEAVAASLGPPEAFAPALPRLTRYKKDIVAGMRRAFEAEKVKARAAGEGAWWGDFDEGAEWGAGPERLAVGQFPTEAATARGGGTAATVPQLCSRMASLHFLQHRLGAIEAEVPLRYATMQRALGGGGGAGVEHVTAWLDGLLDGARQTLASCGHKVADYIACKMVYWAGPAVHPPPSNLHPYPSPLTPQPPTSNP